MQRRHPFTYKYFRVVGTDETYMDVMNNLLSNILYVVFIVVYLLKKSQRRHFFVFIFLL